MRDSEPRRQIVFSQITHHVSRIKHHVSPTLCPKMTLRYFPIVARYLSKLDLPSLFSAPQ